MSVKTKTLQRSIYADADVWERFSNWRVRYPKISDSAFFNAAMSFYLDYAGRGIDPNLMPYTLENGPKLPADEAVARAVEKYLATKRHA